MVWNRSLSEDLLIEQVFDWLVERGGSLNRVWFGLARGARVGLLSRYLCCSLRGWGRLARGAGIGSLSRSMCCPLSGLGKTRSWSEGWLVEQVFVPLIERIWELTRGARVGSLSRYMCCSLSGFGLSEQCMCCLVSGF